MKLLPCFDVLLHTGVTLQEMLETLAPLASSLEVLTLSGNELGGNITPEIVNNIAVFTKLEKLEMTKTSMLL